VEISELQDITPRKNTTRLTEYVIVAGSSPTELAAEVSRYLSSGFLPSGGICAVGRISELGVPSIQFLQPMTKIEMVKLADSDA